VFVTSNLLVFALGSALTVLSYRAQGRLSEPNLRLTTLGFGLITISTVVEAIYRRFKASASGSYGNRRFP